MKRGCQALSGHMTLRAKQASATGNAQLFPMGTNVNKADGQPLPKRSQRSQTSGKLRPKPSTCPVPASFVVAVVHHQRSALFGGTTRRVTQFFNIIVSDKLLARLLFVTPLDCDIYASRQLNLPLFIRCRRRHVFLGVELFA